MQPNSSNNDSQPIFPYHVHNKQILAVPLLAEEDLFTWAFRGWLSPFKYLQEFKLACQ